MKKAALLLIALLAACATPREAPLRRASTTTTPAAVATPSSPSDNAPATAATPLPAPSPRPEASGAPVEPRASTAAPAVPVPDAAPLSAPRHFTYGQFIAYNDERLIDVYVGMKLQKVERIMSLPPAARWSNPYRRETLVADNTPYLVLFYLTRMPRNGRARETDLTPVIFRDDEVVAIGRYPLKKLRQGIALKRRGR